MYIEQNKRPNVISVKIDKETKENLEKEAAEKKWSISQTAYEIIKDYYRNKVS